VQLFVQQVNKGCRLQSLAKSHLVAKDRRTIKNEVGSEPRDTLGLVIAKLATVWKDSFTNFLLVLFDVGVFFIFFLTLKQINQAMNLAVF
jgi:hypothetical protein